MLKLKPGNVFQKLNTMDRKKAYTLGAVVIVCFIALITLASYMGNAEDASFEDMSARQYDLAQMPFVNDEAEKYLLASKYPDMQENSASLLFSSQDKEERQAEDAANEEEEEETEEENTSDYPSDRSTGTSRSGSSSGRYTGRGGSRGNTTVGRLGSARSAQASGSGVNSSFGAPRGDFSTYKSQNKGSELPVAVQSGNARKGLSQFTRGSIAAANLAEGKAGNAKRAIIGGDIEGSQAFTENGLDLDKAGGLTLDTNAPVPSGDLSGLKDAVKDAAQKERKKEEERNLREKMLEQLYSSLMDMGMQTVGNLMNKGIDAAFTGIQAGAAKGHVKNDTLNEVKKTSYHKPEDISAKQSEIESYTRQMDDMNMTQSKAEYNAAMSSLDDQIINGGDAQVLGAKQAALQRDFSRKQAEYDKLLAQKTKAERIKNQWETENENAKTIIDNYGDPDKAKKAWDAYTEGKDFNAATADMRDWKMKRAIRKQAANININGQTVAEQRSQAVADKWANAEWSSSSSYDTSARDKQKCRDNCSSKTGDDYSTCLKAC